MNTNTPTTARRGDITRALRKAGLPLADVRMLRRSTPPDLAATLEHGLDVRQAHDIVRVIHTQWTNPSPDVVRTVREAITLLTDIGYTVFVVNDNRVYFGEMYNTKEANRTIALGEIAKYGATESDLVPAFNDFYITVPVSFSVVIDNQTTINTEGETK